MKKRISPVKVLLACIGCLLALVCAVYCVMMLAIPAFEGVDKTPVEGSADWMAALPGEVSLADMVIPGTHDCATKGVQLAYFSRCQALTVREQLEAGFRYLDVRLAVQDGRLRLMHGFCGCTKTLAPWSAPLFLEDVLADCYAFLEAHPGETILFAVKQDHGEETEAELFDLLLTYVARNPDRWCITDTVPTLARARGRLVLLHRNSRLEEIGAGTGLPLYWEQQRNRTETGEHGVLSDNGVYTVWVQDRFKYDSEDKYAAFLAAQSAADQGDVHIHFLSTNGNTAYGHPAAYARDLNERLLSEDIHLQGWVIVDFGSPALARRIYRENTAADTNGSQTAEPVPSEQPARPEAEPAHREGDRYEGAVTIEGMEETVRYEHVKNDALGFEMGYDYELFRRDSQPDAERFVSVYDDDADPWNYLEVTRSSDSAEAAAASIGEILSQTYDIHREELTLDGAGACICIDASNGRGNTGTPDRLQAVYIIPAPDGCIVAAAHYGFESAEGFGARFRAMLHTLTVT